MRRVVVQGALKPVSQMRVPFESVARKPKDYERARADRLWNRLTFEVTLMTRRMNWLVTSQSFLFAAFFLGVDRLGDGIQTIEFLVLLVPLAGLLISIITLIYIQVANSITGEVRVELGLLKMRYPRHLRDQVDKAPRVSVLRQAAQWASMLLAGFFTAFWLLAGVLLLFDLVGGFPFVAPPAPTKVMVVYPYQPPR